MWWLRNVLVIIRLGVTGLKKTGFMCFLDLFGERKKWVVRVGWFNVCEVLWDYGANSGSVDPIPGNWYYLIVLHLVALLQRHFGACYFVLTRAILCFILFRCLLYVLFRMQWMLVNVNKAKFLQRKAFSKITPWGTPCIRLSLHHEKHIPTCILAYFYQYCFLWSACHVMFSYA